MKQLTFIAILLVFIGCEREIQISEDDYVPYVVVNSIISTDSTWAVQLNYSKSILDRNDFKPVENAEIHISVIDDIQQKEEPIQDFYLKGGENGLYTRGNKPVQGRSYKMTISVEDEIITAQTYVPRVLKAQIIGTASTVVDQQTQEVRIQVEIDIVEENSNSDNYYAWELEPIIQQNDENIEALSGGNLDDIETGGTTPQSIIKTVSGPSITSIITRSDNFFTKAIPTLSNNEGTIIANIGTGFSSVESGGNYTTGGGSPIDLPVINPTTSSKKKYKLKVWAVSLDYYKYLVSIQNKRMPTSESTFVNYYSNIENGGGIFAGYNLKEFEEEIEIEF